LNAGGAWQRFSLRGLFMSQVERRRQAGNDGNYQPHDRQMRP
jgi:hypothetical protein